MKPEIKLCLIAFAAIGAMSCSGNKNETAVTNESMAQDVAAYADIKGQWNLENIVFSDSDYVRPSDEVPGVCQYIVFEDSTYHIHTNCNYCCPVKKDKIIYSLQI